MKNDEKMTELPIMPYRRTHGKPDFDNIFLRVAARTYVRGKIFEFLTHKTRPLVHILSSFLLDMIFLLPYRVWPNMAQNGKMAQVFFSCASSS